MKNKQSKRNIVNLIFSAFLVIAYVVCAYFFAQFAESFDGMAKAGVMAAIFAIFGLLVFYATRVGEGKAIKRFSLATLIILDIPALYIILASIFTVLPLGEQIAKAEIVAYLAAVALGYGIPYTFLSGFELADEDDDEDEEYEEDDEDKVEVEDEEEVLEGGVLADLENAEEAQPEEENDEVVVEGENADAEPVEETEE